MTCAMYARVFFANIFGPSLILFLNKSSDSTSLPPIAIASLITYVCPVGTGVTVFISNTSTFVLPPVSCDLTLAYVYPIAPIVTSLSKLKVIPEFETNEFVAT